MESTGSRVSCDSAACVGFVRPLPCRSSTCLSTCAWQVFVSLGIPYQPACRLAVAWRCVPWSLQSV
jgi:hypothetical protein